MNRQIVTKDDKNIKVAMIVTTVLTVQFAMAVHLRKLAEHFDVTLIVPNDYPDMIKDLNLPVKVKHIFIPRTVSIFSDISALFRLIFYLKREKFSVVHTLSPKAGLIGTLASFVNKIPVRIHTFQGEAWVTQVGIARFLFKCFDKLISKLATHITVVSFSGKKFLIKNKIINERATVLANGSISGVNFERFYPDDSIRKSERERLGLKEDQLAILYLGRLKSEKGIFELIESFSGYLKKDTTGILIIAGPDEEKIEEKVKSITPKNVLDKIIFFPFTSEPQSILNAVDVLVLPSKREGFGMVILEAAACGIPSIGSNIDGIIDAIDDGKTGLLFELDDVNELTNKLLEMWQNKESRFEMGKLALDRVRERYSEEKVLKAMVNFYKDALRTKNIF